MKPWWVAVLALVGAASVTGCGGGGGGAGGVSPGGGGGTPPTSAPATQDIGDVKTVVQPFYNDTISGIVWDPVDGSLVAMDGTKPGPSVLYGNAITLGAANITVSGFTYPSGIVYSSTNHTFYFTQQGVVYKTSKSMTTATIFASAGLTKPSCLAIDSSGNLYAFDVDHIVEISSTGTVHNVTAPGSFPQQPLGQNIGLAYDTSDGNLYFSDPVSDVVWKVTTGGGISVFAGECFTSFNGTGCTGGEIQGTGTSALFGLPEGITYDGPDNVLLVLSNEAIWQLSPSGQARIVAGYGPAADIDANGLQAFLFGPDVAAMGSGVLYFMEGLPGPATDVRTYATTGAAPPAWTPPTMRYPLSDPRYVTQYPSVASDGSVWFLQFSGTVIEPVHVDHETEGGSITSYAVPSGYQLFATGAGTIHSVIDAGGNFWFLAVYNSTQSGILECSPTGTFTFYQVKSLQPGDTYGGAADITRGPDGNVWFAEGDEYGTSIGEVANGAVSQYWVQNNGGVANPLTPNIWPIVTGPDGNIWYAYGSGFGRMTPTGTLLSPITIPSAGITLPTPDASGNIWYFCNSDLQGTADLCRLNASGYSVSSFSMGPNENCFPSGLALAPNGVAWFPSCDDETITSVNTSGSYTLYTMPSSYIAATGTAIAPDGNVWATSTFSALYLLNPTLYAGAGLPVFEPDRVRRDSKFVRR